MPILDRLVGLETEYALRIRAEGAGGQFPSRFRLYRALVGCLKGHVLTVPARHLKDGVFLANGGAVWFETERPAAGGGLVEGATPECRGPRELLRYQRAQDRLLGTCARLTDDGGPFTLVKNDRDARGHVYGAQENYEAILARSWSLWLWRAGLVLLVPFLLLTWACVAAMFVGLLVYLSLAGLSYLLLRPFSSAQRALALQLFGRDLVEGRESGSPTPVWLESCLLWMTRIVTVPLAASLWLLAAATAFRRTRRDLVPFLVSRCVISGAGMIDDQGRYLLADKAPAINCLLGLGGFIKDRPLFSVGHFFKALCAESWLSPRDYFELFGDRQRLQICLGDSNMAEVAEFLRVGTTALVLDVIEAGSMPSPPVVVRPLKAMRDICRDPTLSCRVPCADGRHLTALELQRFYLDACRRFLCQQPDATEEAYEVVARWEQVLDALDELQATGEPPDGLLGTLDWVTKKQLLDEAGTGLAWNALKKIDIRYHELSPAGYFQQLHDAGLVATLVRPDELDRCTRTPPPNSPATMRSHYMREFSSESGGLSVNWKKVVIGRGRRAKVVRLTRYRHRRGDRRELPSQQRQI